MSKEAGKSKDPCKHKRRSRQHAEHPPLEKVTQVSEMKSVHRFFSLNINSCPAVAAEAHEEQRRRPIILTANQGGSDKQALTQI